MNTNYLFSHLAYRIASYVEDTRGSDSLLDELDFSIPALQQALCLAVIVALPGKHIGIGLLLSLIHI